MGNNASKLLEQAMALPPSDRAELAVGLIASLDGAADRDAEDAWATEIGRRAAAVAAGTATSTPWDEVRQSIERDILDR